MAFSHCLPHINETEYPIWKLNPNGLFIHPSIHLLIAHLTNGCRILVWGETINYGIGALPKPGLACLLYSSNDMVFQQGTFLSPRGHIDGLLYKLSQNLQLYFRVPPAISSSFPWIPKNTVSMCETNSVQVTSIAFMCWDNRYQNV